MSTESGSRGAGGVPTEPVTEEELRDALEVLADSDLPVAEFADALKRYDGRLIGPSSPR